VVSLGAITRAPDEGTRVDTITRHRGAFAFLYTFADDVRLPESLEQSANEVFGGGHVGLGLAGERVRRAEKQAEAAEGGNISGLMFWCFLQFGAGKRQFPLVEFFDRVKRPRVAKFVKAVALDAFLGMAVRDPRRSLME
jgi:hypothetical protein